MEYEKRDIERVLVSEEQIKARLIDMGKQITEDYKGKDLLIVGILRGSCVFMTDLIRHIDLPVSIDFLYVSSYGSGTVSSGMVKIVKDLDDNIENKNVLIAEDILDSGITLSHVIDIFMQRHPASLKICSLLNKPDRRVKPVKLDYKGFDVPDVFVVGYGLDYDQKYRNLPYVGELKKEVYSK